MTEPRRSSTGRNVVFFEKKMTSPLHFLFATAFCLQFFHWTKLIGKSIVIEEMVGSVAACMATYVLDRVLPSPEDKINKSMASNETKKSKPYGTAFVFVLVFIICGIRSPHLFRNAMYSTPLALSYSADFLPFRVKSLFPCSKNLYVACMWTGWFFGASQSFPPQNSDEMCIMAVYFAQMFLCNVVMDVKDIKGDRACGIVTIPTLLLEHQTKVFAMMYTSLLSCAALWFDVRTAIAYSLVNIAIALAPLDRCGEAVNAPFMMLPALLRLY